MTNQGTTQPLSICHVGWSGHFGGIERVMHTLAVAQARDHHVEVLFLQSGGHFAEELKKAGIEVHILHIKSGFSIAPAKVLDVLRIFKKVDVVHMHAFNFVSALAGIFAGKRIVYTFHSLTELRRKTIWRDDLKRASIQFLLDRYFHHYTTVSGYIRKEIQRFYPAARNLTVIPNPMTAIPAAIESIDSKDFGWEPADQILLCYGKLVKNKRIDRLLQLMEHMQPKHPHLKCLIIGDGPLKNDLEDLIKSKPSLSGSVQVVPFAANIFAYIQMATACIFPFEKETFGLAGLECMSMGKPAFVFEDAGGLAELVAPIKSGFFVAANPEEMREKVGTYLDKVSKAEAQFEMEEEMAQFAPERIASQYTELYRS